MSKLEYLDPKDWSLHVIDGESEGVPDGWVLVPEGAQRYTEGGFFKNKKTWFSRAMRCWVEKENDSWVGFNDILWQRNPSLNDQYAEIEEVRQDTLKAADVENTLSERQSQYGDFKDVAELTSELMADLIRNDMTFVQREALHMICSKLARIKHGDVNKIDTWHDIAGYATLVVKDLEGK